MRTLPAMEGLFFVISLVINSAGRRKENLNKIICEQAAYPIVDEIILVTPTQFYEHDKLKIVQTNWDIGLSGRWIGSLLAANPCIITQDDDVFATENSLEVLRNYFEGDNDRVHTAYGRIIDEFNDYDLGPTPVGSVDIALTKLCCFNKDILPYIIEVQNKLSLAPLPAKQFPVDDLILSFVSTILYGKKPNLVAGCDAEDLPESDGLHRSPGFYKLRKNYIIQIKKMLGLENAKNIQFK